MVLLIVLSREFSFSHGRYLFILTRQAISTPRMMKGDKELKDRDLLFLFHASL